MQRTFFTEAAYICGITSIAVGTVFMTKADFGVSMIVAPAYLIYLKLSEVWSFVTFGMAEYVFQALLILLTASVLRKFKISYIFSFVTAVLYGFILDGAMAVLAGFVPESLIWRIASYILGLLLCALGVSFMFHTYIAPEAYELFVKEVSSALGRDINRVKTVYDCSSCLLAVVMSCLFFGTSQLVGIGVGTVICALLNGKIIGVFSSILEKHFVFKDGLRRLKVLK